ncbi:MAG: amidohydrolase family protein [Proteobacteria bacterium]|nr:amidohydrolase family protein [Pseudomonadota bacterium]
MSVPHSLDIIDFHTHHVPPSWTLTTAAGRPPQQQALWERINRKLNDFSALMEAIEVGDLAGRVINIPTAMIADSDGNVPDGTVERINDQVAEVAARRPGKLHPLASVDAFSGDAAGDEVHRAIRGLGLRGVFVNCAKGDMLLDAPQARPMLAAAASLGVPVFAHPIYPQPLTRQLSGCGRLGTFLARGTINAASVIALLESGTLEALPDLRVVVTNLALGGVLTVGGFGEEFSSRKDALRLLRRHVFIDTMGFHPVLIRAAVDLLGVENVLVGSDWPIANDGLIAERVRCALLDAGLDDAGQRLVAGGNARRLLRLDR